MRRPGQVAREALKCGQSLAAGAGPREPFPTNEEDCREAGGQRAFLLAFEPSGPMKKSALPALLLLIGAGLTGCPLYDHEDSGCYVNSDCAPGFSCDERDGTCYENTNDACRKPSDCGTNETCSRLGTCTPGDCHYRSVGCVRGYVCSSESGRWQCVAASDGSGGAPSEGGAGGADTEGGSGGMDGSVAGAPPLGGAGASQGGALGAGGEPMLGGAGQLSTAGALP